MPKKSKNKKTAAQQHQQYEERTDTVGEEEKLIMKERLTMFDYLWETSPTVKKMREEYKMKGLQEGLQKGLEEGLQKGVREGRREGLQKGVAALQDVLVNLVLIRFPECH